MLEWEAYLSDSGTRWNSQALFGKTTIDVCTPYGGTDIETAPDLPLSHRMYVL